MLSRDVLHSEFESSRHQERADDLRAPVGAFLDDHSKRILGKKREYDPGSSYILSESNTKEKVLDWWYDKTYPSRVRRMLMKKSTLHPEIKKTPRGGTRKIRDISLISRTVGEITVVFWPYDRNLIYSLKIVIMIKQKIFSESAILRTRSLPCNSIWLREKRAIELMALDKRVMMLFDLGYVDFLERFVESASFAANLKAPS
jgi:hypothetical protein